jgi:hypothetical protein
MLLSHFTSRENSNGQVRFSRIKEERMAGQKAKGLAPDAVLKHYWNGNEEFADLFNAVLFEGREIIKPGELETADTEQSTVLKQRRAVESIKASRDVIKI